MITAAVLGGVWLGTSNDLTYQGNKAGPQRVTMWRSWHMREVT